MLSFRTWCGIYKKIKIAKQFYNLTSNLLFFKSSKIQVVVGGCKMETIFVLLIVVLCAFVLFRKIFKQVKSGKCDCGCGCDNNCGSCSKSDSCMTQNLKIKKTNRNLKASWLFCNKIIKFR